MSEQLRTELTAHLQQLSNDDLCEEYFNVRCSKNRLRGDEINLENSELLGRISYKPALARNIVRAAMGAGFVLDLAAVERQLDSLFGEGEFEESEVRLIFEHAIPDVPMSLSDRLSATDTSQKTIVWLFENPEHCSECSRTDIEEAELPYRLGLPFVQKGSRYIAFEIKGSNLNNPRRPTVLDCSWEQLDIFKPGGKTLPTGGFPENAGLFEVVAISPSFRFIHSLPIGIEAGPEKGS